jgi:hypothetical protein
MRILDRSEPMDGTPFAKAQVSTVRTSDKALLAGLVLASFLFLYFHLFVSFSTPLWTGGDEIIFLADASRMLDGQVLYRDFAQMTFPATDLLYFSAFKVFGAQMWIPNILLLLVGVTLVCLSYFLGERLNLGKLALLPPLLFLSLVYRNRLDATHHWFSALATMAAVAVLITRRTLPRIATAGALCGVAASFTQSLGLLILMAFALFLYWEARRTSSPRKSLVTNVCSLVACFAFMVFAATCYFIWAAGFQKFIDNTVLFSIRYYPSYSGANSWQGYMVGVSEFLHWRRITDFAGFVLIHALLPLVYLLFFVRYRRDSAKQPAEPWDRLMFVNLVGIFSLLSVTAAPTWARLYYVSLPALILFAWFLKSEAKAGRVLSMILFASTSILLVALPVAKQLHHPDNLDLPTGRTAFLNKEAYDRYRWAASETRPGDYFFGGLFPDFYFILNLRNPGPVPFITPYDYTRPAEVQAVLDGLQKHQVKIVLWTPSLDAPENPQFDHLGPLRAYIRSHYHVAEDLPQFEVWFRND